MYIHLKNILDIVFALFLLLLTAPLLIVVMIIIKIEDGGSSIYKADRIGKNNEVITVYKLRSMVNERVKNGVQLTDSERMLKIGKFIRVTSLDELPQLVNILKGEMSFIGPRPLPTSYLSYYTSTELTRHTVKPGISGLAQINGRNNLSWDEKFNYDLIYTKNISLKLDIKIFFLTLIKVIKKDSVVVRGTGQEIDFHQYRKNQLDKKKQHKK